MYIGNVAYFLSDIKYAIYMQLSVFDNDFFVDPTEECHCSAKANTWFSYSPENNLKSRNLTSTSAAYCEKQRVRHPS